MANDEYERALKEAEQELDDLLRKRDAMDARILRLHSTVESLRGLCGKEPHSFPIDIRKLGITDAIRKLLEYANSSMSAIQIRDALEQAGFDLSDQSNPMSSVHSVLNRLLQSSEVLGTRTADGAPGFLWVTPLRRALLEEAENRTTFLETAFGEKYGAGPRQRSKKVEE
ncbi:MAG: hypothetical protein ACLQVM_03420 [Terriglobia bacterium]